MITGVSETNRLQYFERTTIHKNTLYSRAGTISSVFVVVAIFTDKSEAGPYRIPIRITDFSKNNNQLFEDIGCDLLTCKVSTSI